MVFFNGVGCELISMVSFIIIRFWALENFCRFMDCFFLVFIRVFMLVVYGGDFFILFMFFGINIVLYFFKWLRCWIFWVLLLIVERYFFNVVIVFWNMFS